jgi:hypothetical protein
MLLWEPGEGEGTGGAEPRSGGACSAGCEYACGCGAGIDGIRIRSCWCFIASTRTGVSIGNFCRQFAIVECCRA